MKILLLSIAVLSFPQLVSAQDKPKPLKFEHMVEDNKSRRVGKALIAHQARRNVASKTGSIVETP